MNRGAIKDNNNSQVIKWKRMKKVKNGKFL